MKRIIIGASFCFVAFILMAKLLENKSWTQSLFLAVFQTAVLFFAAKYFLKWWNKKSEEQRSKKI